MPENPFSLLFVKFTEILFIDHQTEDRAYFKRRESRSIMATMNYGKNADTYGLWDGVGTDNAYSYQLLICSHSFYSGFFVSGFTRNCFKFCSSWCGDTHSPYFRTASTSPSYKGVAFNINGHKPLDNRLISVGVRWHDWHINFVRCNFDIYPSCPFFITLSNFSVSFDLKAILYWNSATSPNTRNNVMLSGLINHLFNDKTIFIWVSKSNRFYTFHVTRLADSKKLGPLFRPIRSTTKTNVARLPFFSSLHVSCTWNYFEC